MRTNLLATLLTALLFIPACAPAVDADLTDEPFVTFDADADELISVDEYGAGIGDYDTDLVFDDLDVNADGFLDEEEFVVFEDDIGF